MVCTTDNNCRIAQPNPYRTVAAGTCDGTLFGGDIVNAGTTGYVIVAQGTTLYFAGDTNVFSDMQLIEQLYHPELAFLPIGDLFTMSPVEAALACRLLRPGRVIPMHFGTFPPLTGRPEPLRELLGDLRTEVWALKPGEPVEW